MSFRERKCGDGRSRPPGECDPHSLWSKKKIFVISFLEHLSIQTGLAVADSVQQALQR